MPLARSDECHQGRAEGRGRREQREKVYRLLIVVLVGVLVATWVAVVWLVQGKNSAEDELDETKESYAAGPGRPGRGRGILGEMISFDYREIGDEYDWTKYLGDDELREQYEDTIIPRLSKLIRRTKAAAEGEVVQSAYDQIDEDHVDVLAFIRQKLTDIDNKDGVAGRAVGIAVDVARRSTAG